MPVWWLWAKTFPRAAFNLCGITQLSHELPPQWPPPNEQPCSGSAAKHPISGKPPPLPPIQLYHKLVTAVLTKPLTGDVVRTEKAAYVAKLMEKHTRFKNLAPEMSTEVRADLQMEMDRLLKDNGAGKRKVVAANLQSFDAYVVVVAERMAPHNEEEFTVRAPPKRAEGAADPFAKSRPKTPVDPSANIV